MNNIKREERRTQILNAAMRLFVVKGYSDTTVDDIVKKSGLSKGAIYHYFKSKNELFFALIDYWEESFLPGFYKNNYINKTGSETLRLLAKETADNFKSKKYLFLAELEFWSLSNRDNKVRKRIKLLYHRMLSILEKIFNNAVNKKEFKEIDSKMAALAIMTSMQGVIWFSIFEHKAFSAEEYIKEVTEFIIQGFKRNI